MNVCELFLSIEGEGKRTGQPAVFVRKSQCNMRPYCSYCDSRYSFERDPNGNYTVQQLLDKVNEVSCGCRAVTFTGGEPLYCQDENDFEETRIFIFELERLGYEVNVETNGSINLLNWCGYVTGNGFFTMDWKSVSSNASRNMIESNLRVLGEDDVLKFVVGTQEDLDQMKDVLNNHKVRAQVYVSPVFGKIELKDIVKYVLDNKLWNVRTKCQLHKIAWSPDARGV